MTMMRTLTDSYGPVEDWDVCQIICFFGTPIEDN